MEIAKERPVRKPDWLKVKLPFGQKAHKVIGLLNEGQINTICTHALCPNRGECWGNGTATFLIGGNICTRNCKFCNVEHGKPQPIRNEEIKEIIQTIKLLNLKHVVLTSVDRDDLPDLGALHWKNVIKSIKNECKNITMETLIPDFQGKIDLIDLIIEESPEVISHNLETVKRITPIVRTNATYERSLKVIKRISSSGISKAKSGIMLGLGETFDEISQTMDDLLENGCQIMTIGQYLQPS